MWGPRVDGVLLDPVLTRVPALQDCLRGKKIGCGVPQTELPVRSDEATRNKHFVVPGCFVQSKVVIRLVAPVAVVNIDIIER